MTRSKQWTDAELELIAKLRRQGRMVKTMLREFPNRSLSGLHLKVQELGGSLYRSPVKLEHRVPLSLNASQREKLGRLASQAGVSQQIYLRNMIEEMKEGER